MFGYFGYEGVSGYRLQVTGKTQLLTALQPCNLQPGTVTCAAAVTLRITATFPLNPLKNRPARACPALRGVHKHIDYASSNGTPYRSFLYQLVNLSTPTCQVCYTG